MQTSLINEILEASQSAEDELMIRKINLTQNKRNELLFFLKPEIFLTEIEYTKRILDMIFEKFDLHEIEICGSLMISGRCLEKFKIIDDHYGYISRMSREASKILTDNEKEEIKKILNISSISETMFLGGHELLDYNGKFNETTLNELWTTKKSIRLRSGLYFQLYEIKNKKIVLVNAFQPAQVSHFTKDSRKLILLILRSDTNWEILKNDLIGNTFPEKAKASSIRSELFRNKHKYGINNITIANNFSHLSAGPFEALFEINNFISKLSIAEFDNHKSNLVQKGMKYEHIEKALSNPKAVIDDKEMDLFTYTEEKDTDEAINIYQNIFC